MRHSSHSFLIVFILIIFRTHVRDFLKNIRLLAVLDMFLNDDDLVPHNLVFHVPGGRGELGTLAEVPVPGITCRGWRGEAVGSVDV